MTEGEKKTCFARSSEENDYLSIYRRNGKNYGWCGGRKRRNDGRETLEHKIIADSERQDTQRKARKP